MGYEQLNISIFTTMNCNLACEYCYEGKNKKNDTLSKPTADLIIRFISFKCESMNINNVIINFHGGEPLLNHEIIEYIINRLKSYSSIKKKFIRFRLTTNGTLMDDRKIDFLSNNVDYVSISLDGDRETQDTSRIDYLGRGTYDIVVKNALKLLKIKPNIEIRMTISRKNVKDVCRNIAHLVQLGFTNILPVLNYWESGWSEEDLALIERIDGQLMDKCDIPSVEGLNISPIVSTEMKFSKCDGGRLSFSIDALGKIYPCIVCVGNENLCCGDVENGINQEVLDQIEEIKNEQIIACSGCNIYNYCNNIRCRFINYSVMQNYNKPIPLVCHMQHLRYSKCLK